MGQAGSVVILDETQLRLLSSHGLDYNLSNLSDDDICELYQAVGDILVLEGLDENYIENETGEIASSILDELYRLG